MKVFFDTFLKQCDSFLSNSVAAVYWDIIPRLKRVFAFRPNKLISENSYSSKIGLSILTYRRPLLLEKTLNSFFALNSRELEKYAIILLFQGGDDPDTERIINKYNDFFFRVIRTRTNIGLSAGYNLLMVEMLKLGVSYIIHLEDDFLSCESISDHLAELTECLERFENVGCIRLRTVKDRVSNYNLISRRNIRTQKITEHLVVGNAHFTFNPTIAKSSVIRKIIPVLSEEMAMQRYQQMGLKTGQLLADCFMHIGQERAYSWTE